MYYIDEELQEMRDKIERYLEMAREDYMEECEKPLYKACLMQLNDDFYHLICVIKENKAKLKEEVQK